MIHEASTVELVAALTLLVEPRRYIIAPVEVKKLTTVTDIFGASANTYNASWSTFAKRTGRTHLLEECETLSQFEQEKLALNSCTGIGISFLVYELIDFF